ncbi:MAG: RimK family alpha-L-glutamate ligase [Bacilli bacterium]|nr:RimK family alpha-L-glutamate ligase [Bacilli bacterium]
MLHKRCLMIVNAYYVWDSIAHFASRMGEELKRLGIESDVRSAAYIYTYINEKGHLSSEKLPYDFILYLDKDKYISMMLEKAGYRLFNTSRAVELCDDKMLTYLALTDQGLRLPKTVSAPLRYTRNEDENFLQNLVQKLKFPMIMKQNFGSMGKGVFLVQNEEELRKAEFQNGLVPHLYQEFIDTSFGYDYRLILIGGKFYCGYRRRCLTGDFRSNLAQGGVGETCDITQAQIKAAEKAAAVLGLDYCGVDLLDSGDPEVPVLCEVNSNAFIKGAESITGKNIAKAYAEYLYQEVYLK